MTPEQVKELVDRLTKAASALSLLAQERDDLRALLRRIDNRIVWETEEGFGRAFQDEVEAALKDT